MGDYIEIPTEEGSIQAYTARPDLAAAPVVVVLHEVFGVNADLRQTCDELARQGFIAACPDLFWRQAEGVDLSVTSEADWKTGLALYGAYDRDAGVRDIIAAVEFARTMPGASGKVAVLGYCLGGLMTFLVAARGRIDAAVAFHGADTERYLDETRSIAAPMIMHLAEADEFIPPPARAAITVACSDRPNIHVFGYADCHHAFSRHGGTHYDAEAAALANGRTVAFLRENLA